MVSRAARAEGEVINILIIFRQPDAEGDVSAEHDDIIKTETPNPGMGKRAETVDKRATETGAAIVARRQKKVAIAMTISSTP